MKVWEERQRKKKGKRTMAQEVGTIAVSRTYRCSNGQVTDDYGVAQEIEYNILLTHELNRYLAKVVRPQLTPEEIDLIVRVIVQCNDNIRQIMDNCGDRVEVVS
jgi:cystathionine beta-lyase family protein involved in aluminum resistance